MTDAWIAIPPTLKQFFEQVSSCRIEAEEVRFETAGRRGGIKVVKGQFSVILNPLNSPQLQLLICYVTENKRGKAERAICFWTRKISTLNLTGMSNTGLESTPPGSLPTAYATEWADLLRHDPSAAPFNPCCCRLLPSGVKNPLRAWLRQTPGWSHMWLIYRFFFFKHEFHWVIVLLFRWHICILFIYLFFLHSHILSYVN